MQHDHIFESMKFLAKSVHSDSTQMFFELPRSRFNTAFRKAFRRLEQAHQPDAPDKQMELTTLSTTPKTDETEALPYKKSKTDL